MYFIYKITNPKGATYIGQTSNLERRLYMYNYCLCKSQHLIYNSIKKYTWKEHNFEILEMIENKEELDKAEIHWISYFKSNLNRYRDSNGLNLTDGGKGNRGGTALSEEGRRKISEAASANFLRTIGKYDFRKKVYLYNKEGELIQLFQSQTDCSKFLKCASTNISHAINSKSYIFKQYIVSDIEITKDKIELFIKNHSERIKRRNINLKKSCSRKIVQLTIEGIEIKVYEKASDASNILNIDLSSIIKCCRGKIKQYKGFKWKYL